MTLLGTVPRTPETEEGSSRKRTTIAETHLKKPLTGSVKPD
jgi:hypothetical protein